MNGFERLKTMLAEFLGDNQDEALSKIVDYLLERKDLETKYLNEEKTIKGLKDFIHDKAMKHQKGNWCCIADDVVYAWAVMYFALPNSFLKIKNENNKKTSKKTIKTSESKNNVIPIEKAKEIVQEKQTTQISLFGDDEV